MAIGTVQGSRSHKISNRKIAARLPRLCSRQIERRVIPDYCDFTTGSAFSGNRSATDARRAIQEEHLREGSGEMTYTLDRCRRPFDRMRRCELLQVCGFAIALFPLATRAQLQTGRIPVVGFLQASTPVDRYSNAFRQGMRESAMSTAKASESRIVGREVGRIVCRS